MAEKLTPAKRSKPLDAVRLKSEALAIAGLTLQDMADTFRQAYSAVRDALSAEHTQLITHQGEVKEERTSPDHQTRLKAALAAAKIAQDYLDLMTAGADAGDKRQPVSVVINLGDGATAQVTPAQE